MIQKLGSENMDHTFLVISLVIVPERYRDCSQFLFLRACGGSFGFLCWNVSLFHVSFFPFIHSWIITCVCECVDVLVRECTTARRGTGSFWNWSKFCWTWTKTMAYLAFLHELTLLAKQYIFWTLGNFSSRAIMKKECCQVKVRKVCVKLKILCWKSREQFFPVPLGSW